MSITILNAKKVTKNIRELNIKVSKGIIIYSESLLSCFFFFYQKTSRKRKEEIKSLSVLLLNAKYFLGNL